MRYTHSFIMLHAFSMKPSDMIYYKKYLERIIPKNIKINYIYPKAPIRKITCYDNDKYNSWFDYINEEVENIDGEINKKHLIEQCSKIHDILDKEVKIYNGDYSKLFLLGYSQGACMALDAGLSYSNKIGGIIGFKGHINRDIDEYFKTKQDIWVTHGEKDTTIKLKVAEEYYDKYKKKGCDIEFLKQSNANHDAYSGIRRQIKSLKIWLDRKFIY